MARIDKNLLKHNNYFHNPGVLYMSCLSLYSSLLLYYVKKKYYLKYGV